MLIFGDFFEIYSVTTIEILVLKRQNVENNSTKQAHKKIWNNTEKIRRILKFVSNFKGVDKKTFLRVICIFVRVV